MGGGHISQQTDWMDRAWRARAGRVCAASGPGNSIQLAQAVSAGNAATPLAAMGQTRVLESRDGTCCYRVLFWRNRTLMLPIFAFAALEAFRAL